MAAWQEGQIHQGHLLTIERVAETITPESRGEFEAQVLPKAAGRTPQQLAPIARRAARAFESVTLQKNHAEAFTERGVWVTPEDHGMATLSISIPAVLADAVIDRLRRAYKNLPEGDPRGMYQCMSDTATAPAGSPGVPASQSTQTSTTQTTGSTAAERLPTISPVSVDIITC